jgi:hypothetical protein
MKGQGTVEHIGSIVHNSSGVVVYFYADRQSDKSLLELVCESVCACVRV